MVRLVSPRKALLKMVSTLSGMKIEEREEQ